MCTREQASRRSAGGHEWLPAGPPGGWRGTRGAAPVGSDAPPSTPLVLLSGLPWCVPLPGTPPADVKHRNRQQAEPEQCNAGAAAVPLRSGAAGPRQPRFHQPDASSAAGSTWARCKFVCPCLASCACPRRCQPGAPLRTAARAAAANTHLAAALVLDLDRDGVVAAALLLGHHILAAALVLRHAAWCLALRAGRCRACGRRQRRRRRRRVGVAGA